MGLFDTLKNAANAATDYAANSFKREIDALLLPGEIVEDTVRLVADYFVFTSRRVIFVDAKLISSKRAIVSIPYSKISEVVMVSGGMMSFSQEVILRVGTLQHDVKLYDAQGSLDLYKKLVSRIS